MVFPVRVVRGPGLEHIEYPPIDPVPAGVHRPVWSVMIPTYNCAHYLRRTLKSVLAQDPGPEDMQIEVVDDCSTQDDPEAVINEIGGTRVAFFRQPQNLGNSANFTSCIRRARGYWVHILHGDDLVLPGFYRRLQDAFECEPTIGAAFCRHIYMEEDDHWLFLSPLEQKTPGLLSHWLERIAVDSLLQPPSIVVKRRVYEALGGFHPELSVGEDWEMWKRIAVHYPVWYEPQPLACYRQHSSSISARTRRSGAYIADIRMAIEISRSYLPTEVAEELSRKAREHWALCALGLARGMLVRRDLAAATALIREALKCSHSLRVSRSLIALGLWSMWGGTRLLYKTAVG
jgi:glycosyltransferase involved in cell wall biosynthesis